MYLILCCPSVVAERKELHLRRSVASSVTFGWRRRNANGLTMTFGIQIGYSNGGHAGAVVVDFGQP